MVAVLFGLGMQEVFIIVVVTAIVAYLFGRSRKR